VSRQKALTFQTRDLAASGGLPHQTAYPSSKDFGWMAFLGVESRSVRVALAEGRCDLGGSLRLKASVMGRRAVPLFNYALVFSLQLRKSTENIGQGSRAATGLLVAPTRLSFEGQPWLACWTLVHLSYLGEFSQPSVGTSAFRDAGLRGSPHRLTSC
jgi:hypothetical protein